MDIEQARTFLAIAAHGSFLEASSRLHVTQSTVSAWIQHLEADLGATLPPARRRFLQHAKTLVLTVEQARHDSYWWTDRLVGGISAALGRLDTRCRC